jgi:dynactin 1
LKYKLEEKEEEIRDLKKHLKLKVEELSEQKVRASLVEKKAEEGQTALEEKNKKFVESIEEMKLTASRKEK